MVIAAVILAALCAVLGLRLYALEKDIRSCARQLREDEGARVRMAAPNRAAEDLLSAVNRLLELREADEAGRSTPSGSRSPTSPTTCARR